MFYGTDDGNRLVDESNYPESIKKYLEQEKNILIEAIKNHDLIIEVGCIEPRNMERATNNNKRYIGIDIVEEYIKVANKLVKDRRLGDICEFLCIDAERLDDVLKKSKLIQSCSKPLFFFPFNSFGNMNDYNNVLDSIGRIKNADFLLFTYNTDKKSTEERYNYYNNCNYDNLYLQIEENGIRYIADNGLNSMAYNENFIVNSIKRKGLSIETKHFADIGIVYSINTREKELEL